MIGRWIATAAGSARCEGAQRKAQAGRHSVKREAQARAHGSGGALHAMQGTTEGARRKARDAGASRSVPSGKGQMP